MEKKTANTNDISELISGTEIIPKINKLQTFQSDKETILNREKSITLRESIAAQRHHSLNMREDAADAREAVFDVREAAIGVREDAAEARQRTADVREAGANVREEAVDVREGSILRRERGVTSREREIQAAEKILAGVEEHLIKLQQMNAHLVVVALEKDKYLEEVEENKEQIETAKVLAEKAIFAKSDYLTKMSHELRTPLNAILGFSELLERCSPPPSDIQAQWLHQISKAGKYLLELINGILDLATIESGWVALKREPLPLEITILECLAMMESQAKKRDININLIPFDKTWLISADPIRVKQVLLNILSNAIKYNRDQGTVEVRCASVSENIRISIIDSGKGLPAEKVAQLFQPFNRLGQESGAVEGTGIGLVVSKQLVELMGGTLNVVSTVGVGSEFWIELQRVDAGKIQTTSDSH